MKLLGIDTSTSSTVLGLKLGERVLERTFASSEMHSREILPAIQSLLIDAGLSLRELDALVFGQGPGSFTGLRIAIGVVQGLGYGLNIPAVPVSSMACIAQSAFSLKPPPLVFVGVTAREEEIYYGAYRFEKKIAVPLIAERVGNVAELPRLTEGKWVGYGNAMSELKGKIQKVTGVSFDRVSNDSIPSVQHLLALGSFKFSMGESINPMKAMPVYLRKDVVYLPVKS